MRICIFEDSGVALLEPLALTRPAFALWCGARTLLERHRAMAAEVALWVRPELVELCRLHYPELPVNDEAWLHQGQVVLINARWLPDEAPLDAAPGVGLAQGQVAYLAMAVGEALPDKPDAL